MTFEWQERNREAAEGMLVELRGNVLVGDTILVRDERESAVVPDDMYPGFRDVSDVEARPEVKL